MFVWMLRSRVRSHRKSGTCKSTLACGRRFLDPIWPMYVSEPSEIWDSINFSVGEIQKTKNRFPGRAASLRSACCASLCCSWPFHRCACCMTPLRPEIPGTHKSRGIKHYSRGLHQTRLPCTHRITSASRGWRKKSVRIIFVWTATINESPSLQWCRTPLDILALLFKIRQLIYFCGIKTPP